MYQWICPVGDDVRFRDVDTNGWTGQVQGSSECHWNKKVRNEENVLENPIDNHSSKNVLKW